MRKNKHNFLLKISLLMMIGSAWAAIPTVQAEPESERVYLLQLVHQLEALKMTVLTAEKQRSPDARVQFHYRRYQNEQGIWCNGVWEDLQRIQAGIEERLDHPPLEPRSVIPIEGDYTEKLKKKSISEREDRQP